MPSGIAVAVAELPRQCLNKIGRRIVGYEMACELCRDMMRRRGMTREIVERRRGSSCFDRQAVPERPLFARSRRPESTFTGRS